MPQREYWVTNTAQLAVLQRRLDAVGRRDWRNNLNRRIRRAAQPTKDDLVATVLRMPIRGQIRTPGSRSGRSGNTRPLRATIAAALRLSVTTGGGTRIWVDKGRLPPDLHTMPENLNEGHWRHPVFGNRSAWSSQYAQRNWWWDTIRRHHYRMAREVEQIMNDVRRMLG